MSLSTPTQITIPFADTGARTAIPQAANNTTGRAGYDLGFPPINLTPKVAGGIPPFGQDMNGILYDITLAEQFIQAGGSWPYDSAFAAAVGGYPLGALVQRSDSSGFWRNTVANNTTDPDAGGANWVPEDAGATSVAMSSSNVTLSALQAARSTIIITGVLTSNLNLIFPNYSKNWTVINNATGVFAVTCKTSAGTGVALRTGNSAVVTGDGSTGIGWGFGSNFSAGSGDSGYQKLPSGLIVQWGRNATGAAGGTSVTFPLAFPETVTPMVVVTDIVPDGYTLVTGSIQGMSGVSGRTATGFVLHANGACVWLAIGW